MIISFDGLPGCKKHIIYPEIEKIFKHHVYLKSQENINLFQELPNQVFNYQLDRLASFATLPPNAILINSLYSMKNVYTNYYKHKENISYTEYLIYDKLYRIIYKPPDLIIYFYGTYENVFKRQNKHTNQEFQQLHYQFEWTFDNNNCEIPIYKINIDEDLDTIIKNLTEIFAKYNILPLSLS